MTSTFPLEQEAKFWVPDLAAFRAHLEALGAQPLTPRTHEYNLRFDTPTEELTQEGRVLRLRRDRRVTLTYKGPGRAQDGLLVRQELEMEVPDFDLARRLLEALGYRVVFVYEKFRTLYRFGEVVIALDETPVGTFVEIEGPSPKAVMEAARKLGLDPAMAIPHSYASLFREVRERLGLPVRHLTFDEWAHQGVDLNRLGLRPGWRPEALPSSGCGRADAPR